MTLIPQSAFGRTLMLLLALAAFILVGTLLLGGVYRAQSWGELVGELVRTRLQLIAPVIATLGPDDARRFVAEEYAAEGLTLAARPSVGRAAPLVERLVTHGLQRELNAGAEVQVAHGKGLTLWVRTRQTGGLWLGMRLPPRGGRLFLPFLLWLGLIALIAVSAALWFARQLTAPLRRLAAIAPILVHGEPPADFRPTGTYELRALSAALLEAANQAKQLREERELWLAGISHDLRTPLARLRFAAEMLPQELDLRPGVIEDVEEMDVMLGQFLDYLRLGREETLVRCDIVELLRESLGRVAGAEAVELDGTLSAAVRPQAFVRAVGNLVLNALRYGMPPVRVRVGEEGGRAYVEVRDAGPGFVPDQLDVLSAPFTQGAAARGDGSGLGLAIARGVAELHGGNLHADRDSTGFTVGLNWPRFGVQEGVDSKPLVAFRP